MECPLCGHPKADKHGKTSIGSQRDRCPNCQQTYTDTFDSVYYRRPVNQQRVRVVLPSHAEGSSLRGVSRISRLADNTGLRHYPSREPEGFGKIPISEREAAPPWTWHDLATYPTLC